jgi:D-proline reductase (dithiol) PrdB
MRPPRAMVPKDFKIGNSLGQPGMKDLHKKVLKDALLLLTAPARPGEVIEFEYPEYSA